MPNMTAQVEAPAPSPTETPDAARATVSAQGITKAFGTTPVLRGVDLHVAAGSMVALLGPSGCGKTTLLRSIAGLESPESGRITIDDHVVLDGRTNVAPEHRRIGMVFQDWALFPHLSVGANVGYGLTRDERRTGRIEESLELVGLGGLAGRMPGTLSGGQQQRVALARALAPRPRAILLDEPFSNLDTSLRVQVRTEVHALLSSLGITTLFVTHDQEEAFVLGDEVAVMTDGQIIQQGSPAEMYDDPGSRWVAAFVGESNLLHGDADGQSATTRIGSVPLRRPAHGPVDVLLRPEHLRIDPARADDPAGALATVELIEFYGHDNVAIVRFDDGTDLRVRSAGAPRVRRGDRVVVHPPLDPTVAFSNHG